MEKLCECGCDPPVQFGFCHCRCGNPAPLAKSTWIKRGWIKGQPFLFIKGHNRRGKPGLKGIKHGRFRHGGKGTQEYESYCQAKWRCTNPRNQAWLRYGGRGIKFLFTSFEQFLSELGRRPAGMTLDRTSNDGNYQPGNVRWATPSEQMQNRRPYPKNRRKARKPIGPSLLESS